MPYNSLLCLVLPKGLFQFLPKHYVSVFILAVCDGYFACLGLIIPII